MLRLTLDLTRRRLFAEVGAAEVVNGAAATTDAGHRRPAASCRQRGGIRIA